jgi:hypothetical protein
MDSTVISTDFVADCFQCFLKGSRNEIVVCLTTVAVGAVLRLIEKRKYKLKTKL